MLRGNAAILKRLGQQLHFAALALQLRCRRGVQQRLQQLLLFLPRPSRCPGRVHARPLELFFDLDERFGVVDLAGGVLQGFELFRADLSQPPSLNVRQQLFLDRQIARGLQLLFQAFQIPLGLGFWVGGAGGFAGLAVGRDLLGVAGVGQANWRHLQTKPSSFGAALIASAGRAQCGVEHAPLEPVKLGARALSVGFHGVADGREAVKIQARQRRDLRRDAANLSANTLENEFHIAGENHRCLDDRAQRAANELGKAAEHAAHVLRLGGQQVQRGDYLASHGARKALHLRGHLLQVRVEFFGGADRAFIHHNAELVGLCGQVRKLAAVVLQQRQERGGV